VSASTSSPPSQIRQQPRLAIKRRRRGELRRAFQQQAEAAQKRRLRGREAEIADEQAAARHPLGKALQENQQRVEKRRVASGNEVNIHAALP
jgi:hypothetical protein